jgi:WD40 repeat protein
LSRDKKTVAFINYDFTISVFDLATGEPIVPAPKYADNPPSMHLAPDDSKITVAWERHNVATWNVPSATQTIDNFGYGHVILTIGLFIRRTSSSHHRVGR